MPFDAGPVLMYVGAGRYRTVGVANYVGQRQVFRWGALANPHRRPGIGPDLPLMLLITAAGAAAVVGVFAAVHLLIDRAGRLI
jgi:hypothetical protein